MTLAHQFERQARLTLHPQPDALALGWRDAVAGDAVVGPDVDSAGAGDQKGAALNGNH